MEDTLGGALVAARIRIQHHRFPSFESFSGRITSLYVLNKGVDAPDFGEALFVSRPAGSDHANVGLKSMDSSDSVPSSSRNNIPHLSCSVADNAEKRLLSKTKKWISQTAAMFPSMPDKPSPCSFLSLFVTGYL